MRRVVSLVVLGLGMLGIAAGILLRFYAYPALAKIPHDINSTSIAQGGGITALVYVPVPGSTTASPEIRRNLSLTSSTKVTGDLHAPEVERDSDVTSWIELSKVIVDDTDIVVNGGARELCLNRFTGEAVAPCTNGYLQKTQEKDQNTKVPGPPNAPQFPGLNFKFPFQTEQKTYQWYDSSLGKPIDAKYDGQDTISGVDVYRFKQSVPTTNIDNREVPGSLIGLPDATVKAGLYYEVERTIWIEPMTGAVIKLRQWSKQELRTADQGAGTGTVVFDGTLELNEKSVANNVKTANDNMSKLWLLTGLPVYLWIGGGVLILLGIVLLVMSRRQARANEAF